MVDEDFAWRLAQDLVKIDSSTPAHMRARSSDFIKRLIEQQLAQLDSPALDAVQIKDAVERTCPGAATLWSPCRD